MCLILVAWQVQPHFPCVVAANRDEFFGRPTAEADWWPGDSGILAGRDLQAGGTWLGVTRTGRFAALTNYRDPAISLADAPSRGKLVTDFLESDWSTSQGLREIARRGKGCNPFNMLCSDGSELGIYESTTGASRTLEPGVYALSNHLLDTPWPKVRQAKSRLAAALDDLPKSAAMLDLLRDAEPAADEELPRTGVSLAMERMLSSAFIHGEAYGTRCSTIVTTDSDGAISFAEWSWDEDGALAGMARYHFHPEPAGAARA
jgi:uncharacterized protein with NRDE domain